MVSKKNSHEDLEEELENKDPTQVNPEELEELAKEAIKKFKSL